MWINPKLLSSRMRKIPWSMYTTRIMQKKCRIFYDFGLRSPVIQKTFQTKIATSIVARAIFFSPVFFSLVWFQAFCSHVETAACQKGLTRDFHQSLQVRYLFIVRCKIFSEGPLDYTLVGRTTSTSFFCPARNQFFWRGIQKAPSTEELRENIGAPPPRRAPSSKRHFGVVPTSRDSGPKLRHGALPHFPHQVSPFHMSDFVPHRHKINK